MSANILSISSHVAYGHVGNSAAVFALQRLGCEVWPVPTVLYSNHPGHGDFRGEAVTAPLMAELLAGLARRGAYSRCHAVLTGYLREPAQVRLAHQAVTDVKAANEQALYCCDPVMGDHHTGLYVPERVAAEIADRLVAHADVVTPNAFELEFLTGSPIASVDEALAAADGLRARGPGLVVCTSPPSRPNPSGAVAALAAAHDGAWAVRTPRLERAPHGAGDLFAALVLGSYLEGGDAAAALRHAVSATFAILSASVGAGSDELSLIEAQEEIVAPGRLFEVERLS